MKQVRHQEKAAETPGKLPGGFVLDPSKHYVKVERETPKSDYVSPLDEMLEDGYALEAGAKTADLGKARFALLSIDKAEFDARQKAVEDEARAAAKRISPDMRQGEIERVESGTPLTAQGLERLMASQTPA